MRKSDRKICKDCKVMPGEGLTTQHRLLVLDIKLKERPKKKQTIQKSRIKWWNLKNNNQLEFKEKLLKERVWSLEADANTMWLEMSNCIKRVASSVLGISKGIGPPQKETWWWNEDVQKAIKTKRELYRKIHKCHDEDLIKQYKEAKTVAKKAVSKAKTNFMEDLYTKLNNQNGEKFIYRLAKLRDKKKQDLYNVKCIKDKDQKILTREEDIKERWRNYFNELFNDNQPNTTIEEIPNEQRNLNFTRNIRISEVKEALRKMKIGKACGPDEIPIEVWKCLGENGLMWLTTLFNKILKTKRMPMEWRKSTLIPIFKNKGDIQTCSNYRGIKLMSHTMKLWERIIECRLRKETTVSENQFGFMPGRSTMEAIFLIRQLMEKYREKKKDLHMIFIDLEKAYDRVPRDILWWVLERKGIHARYIDTIKDMYEDVVTSIKIIGGTTREFPITIGLHQGSALSPYLFALVIDELTRHIQDDIPWCMLFADDIVLIDETIDGVNRKLEMWRDALESKGLKLSRSKTEYMHCKFKDSENQGNDTVYLGDIEVPKIDHFRYLGSIIQKDGNIENDVIHRIQAGWKKWRSATGVICDRNIPIKLKGKFYKTAIRPAILYGSECWAIKKQHIQKISVAEMRMLRWLCGKTRKDKIRNTEIQRRVGVAPIGDKIKEGRLRWFGHVQRRPANAPVRKLETLSMEEIRRERGRPRITWDTLILKDLKENQITPLTALDRAEWRRWIHVADPN